MKDISVTLYTIEGAADLIGMSKAWVDRMVREGKIAAVRMGNNRKISSLEIERIKKEGVAL